MGEAAALLEVPLAALQVVVLVAVVGGALAAEAEVETEAPWAGVVACVASLKEASEEQSEKAAMGAARQEVEPMAVAATAEEAQAVGEKGVVAREVAHWVAAPEVVAASSA